jgi:hypothetical protein
LSRFKSGAMATNTTIAVCIISEDCETPNRV